MSGANWPVRRSGGVSCRSSVSGGGSVDGGAGHCPDALGSCGAARLPGCSAAGRMRPSGRIFPFQTIRSVPSGVCGGLRSRLPDIRIPLSSLRAAAAGFKEALAVGCVMYGLTGALLPDGWRRSGGRRTHHTSGTKESLLTACRVQSRMSRGCAALLSGTDSLRLGEGFSVVPVIRSCTKSAWPEDRQFRVGCW